jgi:hypothetical protein
MPNPSVKFEAEMRRFGVVPSNAFGAAFELEPRQSPDGDEVQLFACETVGGAPSFVVTLAPEYGFAMTGLTVYKNGRVIEEFSASDFRLVDGVFVPFKTTTVLNERAPRYYVAEREIEHIEINRPFADPEKVFEIPDGYRVQDFTQAQNSRTP